MFVKLSGVAGLQRPEHPLLVVFTEKGLSKLVTADHDGTGWGHFAHPGEETWQRGNRKGEVIMCYLDGHKYNDSQRYLPANSPTKPSCATILLITLKVEEETREDTEKTKTTVNMKLLINF